jgi:hypothetical protein
MKKLILLSLVLFIVFSFCSRKTNQTTNQNNTGLANSQKVSVLTQHNNFKRTGWNNQETSLNIQNVNSTQFGKLFTLMVDDQVYSQPLVFGGLSIAGGVHNVVFIATVNNTVYAFDGTNGTLYWQKNYTQSGMRPPQNTDMTGACGGAYEDFTGNIGIVGTPVIDSINQVMFFVARSSLNGNVYYQYLHKISLSTGAEMGGSPVKITATYPGTGDGNINGVINFDPQKCNQRAALTLSNGVVYITTSSHCDWGPYHGWVLGYNTSTLQQQYVFNTTPNDANGGIWQSGGGMAVDDQGNLYTGVGNGGGGVSPSDGKDFGQSAIKLSPSGNTLQVTSSFTPYNYQALDDYDLDFGSFGSFLIPNSSYLFTGGKDGNMYLLNKDNMGGFDSTTNHVYQNINFNASNAAFHTLPAYYGGTQGSYVYIWSENDVLRAVPFITSTQLLNKSGQILGKTGPTGGNGANLSVSSNGSNDNTAIIWATYSGNNCDAGHTNCSGILRAFSATNPNNLLWSSDGNPADAVGIYAKFNSPTIANGHVYVPTFSGRIDVFGLK